MLAGWGRGREGFGGEKLWAAMLTMMMTTWFAGLSLQASTEQRLRQGGRTTKAAAVVAAGGGQEFCPSIDCGIGEGRGGSSSPYH